MLLIVCTFLQGHIAAAELFHHAHSQLLAFEDNDDDVPVDSEDVPVILEDECGRSESSETNESNTIGCFGEIPTVMKPVESSGLHNRETLVLAHCKAIQLAKHLRI